MVQEQGVPELKYIDTYLKQSKISKIKTAKVGNMFNPFSWKSWIAFWVNLKNRDILSESTRPTCQKQSFK